MSAEPWDGYGYTALIVFCFLMRDGKILLIRRANEPYKGEITVPGSKSHTIRAVLLASMAQGKSVIHNPLTSEDRLSAVRAARAFGAEVIEEKGAWIVTGGNLVLPENVVDTGNSGTTTIFIM
ncbi:MAG: hypothetical protein LBT15_06515, partial [Synergistaceae bacterium]|nr:hypothetical protein [Synergistaceae bacterium]